MPFKRFFGKSTDNQSPAQPESNDDPGLENDAQQEADGDAEAAPQGEPERTWHERAMAVLPTGASTGSKRAESLYGDSAADDLPTHFVSATGALVTDVHGHQYIDCTMALGAVALGYSEPRVVHAVLDAVSEGNVSGLSGWREVEVAERLCSLISFGERVQFTKTGAEATTAAVRLARIYTGRDHVIACGYFGWHDWCSEGPGIPSATLANVTRIPFDDTYALEQAVSGAGTSLAAIILEPIIERAPSKAWLERARLLCDSSGAVLIFDEMKTGFRVAPSGYSEVSGVSPDLATYGKALTNGFPLAAIVGRAPIMEAARKTWISSTLASESTALAAAIAVLDWHDEADICASLAETGRDMRAAVDRAIAACGIKGVSTRGIDQMWLMKWDDPALENRFVAEAMRRGVFFKRGAYNFAAIAHDEAMRHDIEEGTSAALVALLEDGEA